MKNSFVDRIKSKVIVEIAGKSPERFILKLNKNKIDVFKVKKLNKDKYEIIINYTQYDKLLELNTIYEIKIKKYLGIVEKKNKFFKYYHVIFSFVLFIIGLYLLSNVILSIDIVTTNEDMKAKIMSTLKENGISKYKIKKDYNYIQNLKKIILEKYSDEIEWLEIEEKGTKYILKFEPRIIKKNDNDEGPRHVIAKKNAIIKSIYSSSGQILKPKDSYVKKGEIIVSGDIYSNDELKKSIRADATIYGEVWYVIRVTYPFNYYEQSKTGRVKNVFSVKIFNNCIDLFNFNPFNDKIVSERILLKSNIFPIKLVKQFQEEVVTITGMNVVEELEIKALELAYNKIEKNLSKGEYIFNHKVLDRKIIDKGIEMTIFFSVCENISDYYYIRDTKEVE